MFDEAVLGEVLDFYNGKAIKPGVTAGIRRMDQTGSLVAATTTATRTESSSVA
ncbi:MAG: hypothetical protein Q8M01_10785 [Rubrivivax sp.]|nr:hypothetical protein [Rubrivivax sp.]